MGQPGVLGGKAWEFDTMLEDFLRFFEPIAEAVDSSNDVIDVGCGIWDVTT